MGKRANCPQWKHGRPWESAQSFHWCVRVILRCAEGLNGVSRKLNWRPFDLRDTLNARYDAAGEAGRTAGRSFGSMGRARGCGRWQSSSRFRLRPLPREWAHAVNRVALSCALWQSPCYDCWEEQPSQIHISTLAAIYGGLQAAERLIPSLDFTATTEAIRAFVRERGLTSGGELAKWVGSDEVDANLIAAAVPFGLLSPDDPIMERTIARIERELHAPGSGVHRYLGDVYYGGGAWVLLALWLAWYYAERGLPDRSTALLAWAERQADADGNCRNR